MLLGNYSVHNRNPLRFLGGSGASPEVNHWPNFMRGGMAKNRQYVSATTSANRQFSLPYGSYPPYTSLLPQRGGDLSARRSAELRIVPEAVGGMGMPGVGTASLAIATNTPAGQLIVSGSGSAQVALTTNAPLLTASINGVGTASLEVTINTPVLGAIASLTATASLSVTTNAPEVLPVDDASPLRTGLAQLSLSAELARYAIGHMEGTTLETGAMTPTSVATAVWQALAADFNAPGTTGAKLNSASAAGDPWTAELPGAYPPGSAGDLLGNLIAGLTPEQTTQLLELWRLAGLDQAAPLVVTQAERTAGAIAQGIAEADGTVTVTRQ